MKKIILIIIIIMLYTFYSCQIITTLLNSNDDVILKVNNFSFNINPQTISSGDKGCKSSSFVLDNLIISSLVNISNGQIKFYVKNLNNNSQFAIAQVYLGETNSNFNIETGFDFTNIPNPFYYLPIFEKPNNNIGGSFIFYFLNSQFVLNKFYCQISENIQDSSYKINILSSEPCGSIITGLNNFHTARLYNLEKSDKIAYMTFINDFCFIYKWDKDKIEEEYTTNSFGILNFNLNPFTKASLCEYDEDKLYTAFIGKSIQDNNYYLILSSLNLTNDNNQVIYNSKNENKIANNYPVKLIYISERNKLYIAWSFKENSKDYVAISEYNITTNKLNDIIKIDITGKALEDINISQNIMNGIKNSTLFLSYSLSTTDSTNKYLLYLIKTNNFSDDNWNIYKIIEETTGGNVYFSSFSQNFPYIMNISNYNYNYNQLNYSIYLVE